MNHLLGLAKRGRFSKILQRAVKVKATASGDFGVIFSGWPAQELDNVFKPVVANVIGWELMMLVAMY
jgi:hypothetical protein